MNRLFGIVVMVAVVYGALMLSDESARTLDNHRTQAQRLGFYGVMTVGVGVLIISGGIDLSIGSVVALGAVCFGLLLERQVPPWLAALAVIIGSAGIGLIHGLLVTRLGLQPFLVTLCGLFIYRGVARCLSASTSVGLNVNAPPEYLQQIQSFRNLLVGEPFGVPQELVILILLSLALAFFLHGTVHGRYLYAIGANEEAARYAGIPTARYKVLAYILCSSLVGLQSVLEILGSTTAQATQTGQLYELFAITGAVLGGCSLSGGEGTIPGMFLGAAVLPLLRQLSSFAVQPLTEWIYEQGLGDYRSIVNELDYVVIGLALLLGTIVDQLLRRRGAARKG